ncbi:MAG: hypothetical protein JNK38_02315 [Acidobacteria bacterium]|nr:hypothetical protein [Acidobacteriota bacterium]
MKTTKNSISRKSRSGWEKFKQRGKKQFRELEPFWRRAFQDLFMFTTYLLLGVTIAGLEYVARANFPPEYDYLIKGIGDFARSALLTMLKERISHSHKLPTSQSIAQQARM